MAGSIVENLSNRKLCYILLCLLGAQIAFFMLGGLIAPKPSSYMSFDTTVCEDRSMGGSKEWFYLRGTPRGNCKTIADFGHWEKSVMRDAREMVFVAQMPHVRNNVQLEYSPWFQSILALITVDIEYSSQDQWHLGKEPTLLLEVRLGYKTTAESNQWEELAADSITRQLDCTINEDKKHDGYHYSCAPMELFELGSSDFPFYLLNIRIPSCNESNNRHNCEIGRLTGLEIVEIHQNGGFTRVWLAMKTFMVVPVIAALYFYWGRIRLLPRRPYLVEKTIFAVGVTMAAVDFPLEWLGFMARIPCMLLLLDIKQGIFYTILFAFWLIFLGEHLTGDSAKHSLENYWRQLATVFTASACLFTFDMCERGVHLTNPFYSIWATKFGANLAYGFIIVASLSMGIYFVFVVGLLYRVWIGIKRKRAAMLTNASSSRRHLRFENVIYRFKFILVLTGICIALTIAATIMSSVGEAQLRWGEWEESPMIHFSSAFLTGVFGNWNLYVILLLILYAPSHKRLNESIPIDNEDDEAEEVDSLFEKGSSANEFVTESSALTTFIKPASS